MKKEETLHAGIFLIILTGIVFTLVVML